MGVVMSRVIMSIVFIMLLCQTNGALIRDRPRHRFVGNGRTANEDIERLVLLDVITNGIEPPFPL